MKVITHITTYDRERDLLRIVSHLNSQGISPIIRDDGSKYEANIPNYYRHEHRGKTGFINTWNEILEVCKEKVADLYIFMPDDFHDLDLERLYEFHEHFKLHPYACNIINDSRTKCWTNIGCYDMGEYYRIGFVDCGFFCNREALERINFNLGELPERWHIKENRSSGVGMLLSKGFFNAKVNMYTSKNSLAFHGDHESKMHKDERKNKPLISI